MPNSLLRLRRIIWVAIFLLFNNLLYAQICIDLKSNSTENIKEVGLDSIGFNVLLLGETHGLKSNAILQTKFYTYLNKNAGVDNLLIEWGRADAFLINKYIETGSNKYLKWSSFGYFDWKEELNSIKFIRDNCSKETKVFGLDFEREPSFTAAIFFLIDSQLGDLKKQLRDRLDTLKYSNSTEEIRNWITKNKLNFEAKNKNTSILKEITTNKSLASNFYQRDNRMYEYFNKIKKDGQKYFGRMGTMHTQLDNSGVFAGLIRKYQEIIVFNIHYEDSYYNEKTRVKYSYLNDKGFFKKKTIRYNLEYFNNLSSCSDYIIKLKPENKYIGSLAAKGQYLIFLRNKTGL